MIRTTAFLAAIAFCAVGAVSTLHSVAEEKPRPKDGEKLPAGTEEKLKWGEPVNGLRASLIIRPVPGEPKPDDLPDLYLVVQNVSKTSIRLNDTAESPKRRELYLKIDGKIQMGLGVKEPTLGDVLLQPRQVAYLLMFPPDAKDPEKRRVGTIIAEGTLKDTHQTMIAEMTIEQAPAGAWRGKLVTGETSGAVAAGKPEPKAKKA